LAVLMAGLILSRGLETHEKSALRNGGTVNMIGYQISVDGFTDPSMRNRDSKVRLAVTTPSQEKFEALPGLYYFQGSNGDDSAMIWPHIQRYLSHDVYLTLHEPAISPWKDPAWFNPGESKTITGITVKYEKFLMEGQPGQPGTRFGAKVKVTVPVDDPATGQQIGSKTYDVTPEIVVGEGPTMPQIDQNFRIVMNQMDAGSKSVSLQVVFSDAIFPIELFYKPLTILVWLGTGILFVGGLLSAWARRTRKLQPVSPVEEI
jgi:cytochrome c-type biogenesis protein CcmF